MLRSSLQILFLAATRVGVRRCVRAQIGSDGNGRGLERSPIKFTLSRIHSRASAFYCAYTASEGRFFKRRDKIGRRAFSSASCSRWLELHVEIEVRSWSECSNKGSTWKEAGSIIGADQRACYSSLGIACFLPGSAGAPPRTPAEARRKRVARRGGARPALLIAPERADRIRDSPWLPGLVARPTAHVPVHRAPLAPSSISGWSGSRDDRDPDWILSSESRALR